MVAPHCLGCIDCRTPSDIARSNARRLALVAFMAVRKISIWLPGSLHRAHALSRRAHAAFMASYKPVRSVWFTMAAVKAASAAFAAAVAVLRSQVADRQIGHLVSKSHLLRGIHGRIIISLSPVRDILSRNPRRSPPTKPRTLRVTLALGCLVRKPCKL